MINKIGIFLALSLVLAVPVALAVHFWSPVGFSVSRVGNETFDTLTNFSKQGNGCSIIDGHLNCPLDSGVTYDPQPNPDGNTLPNLSSNTNNFTIEWDMQIVSCEAGYYPVIWGSNNTKIDVISIHYNDFGGLIELRGFKNATTIPTIQGVYPDGTWHHYKATFFVNDSFRHSISIAINGTDKANMDLPTNLDPVSMSFQFKDDHCSINADNLTMYNGTVFPFEVFNNATLTITKLVINNDTGTKNVADFTLKINNTVVVSGSPATLEPGVYKVSEIQDLGYSSSISGYCNSDGFITLNPGNNKSCTITNDDIPPLGNGSLTLIKIVVNNDTCKLTASNFTLRVNNTIVKSGVPNQFAPGFYNVNEIQDPQYSASFLGDCDSSGNLVLGQNQNKICIIVNDDILPGSNNTGNASVNNTFDDDFNRPNSTVLGNGWSEISGDFQILNMQLRNKGAGTHKAVEDGFSGFNLSAAADFTSTYNGNNPTFGIISRYQNQSNYYFFYRTVGGTSSARISKIVNGAETVLASAAIANPSVNSPFKIEGRAIGNNLSIFVDGIVRAKISDSTFSNGKTGIFVRTPSNITYIVDNFFATNKP